MVRILRQMVRILRRRDTVLVVGHVRYQGVSCVELRLDLGLEHDDCSLPTRVIGSVGAAPNAIRLTARPRSRLADADDCRIRNTPERWSVPSHRIGIGLSCRLFVTRPKQPPSGCTMRGAKWVLSGSFDRGGLPRVGFRPDWSSGRSYKLTQRCASDPSSGVRVRNSPSGSRRSRSRRRATAPSGRRA